MLPAGLVTIVVIRASALVLVGMLAAQLISFPPVSGVFVVLFSAAALLLLTRARRDVLAIGIGAFAFLWAMTSNLEKRLDLAIEGDSVLADVRVTDFPTALGPVVRFTASVEGHPRLPERVELRWFEPPSAVQFGDVWRLELRLRRPRGSLNPGGRDAAARALERGLHATGYVANGRHNRRLAAGALGPVDAMRVGLDRRIEREIVDRETAAVIAAIGIGARHRLSPEQWQRFAATGTTHLMAISGLHVGLAATSVSLFGLCVLGLCGVRRRLLPIAIGLGLIAAVAYAMLSGFAVPARRAALMLAIAGLALLRRREIDGLRVLATVALGVALINPLTTMSAGFRLSFAAVAVLIVVARRRPVPASQGWRTPVFGGRRLAVAQLALFFGLLPLTILQFDRVSLGAPFVNFLAVPAFGFVTVPLTLAGLALGGPMEAAGNVALQLAAQSVGWIERLLVEVNVVPAYRPVPALHGLSAALIMLPLAWIALPPGFPGRAIAWLAVIAALAYRPAGPAPGCATLTVLDVGQGLAAVVETANHVLVYDTGPGYLGGGSSARSVVLPFLRHRGIGRIDHLVVSHLDLDHAGGLGDLLASVPVDAMSAGEVPVHGPPSGVCSRGQTWAWDGVRFDVLHPPADAIRDGNDASCVVLVTAGDRRFLLTGDIEAESEARLVRDRRLPRVDLVVVPHHGSRTSSTLPFVRATRPRYAIVSAGYRNRWSMPADDVVKRWRGIGAEILNTAEAGAVSHTLCSDHPGREAIPFRRQYRRAWHRDVDARFRSVKSGRSLRSSD